jgi:hypothetical protein
VLRIDVDDFAFELKNFPDHDLVVETYQVDGLLAYRVTQSCCVFLLPSALETKLTNFDNTQVSHLNRAVNQITTVDMAIGIRCIDM